MFATLPDALRLLVVPVFAWAALRDVRTRRLPNRLWPPLYLFGALVLVWETATLWPLAGVEGRLFLVRAAISLIFVAPLGYAFWYLGAFGGADAKALIALALVFPTFPTYEIVGTTFPLVDTQLGVFSLTILTNTVLLGLAYPIGLAAVNLARGHVSPTMFLARPVSVYSLSDRHGRLFEDDVGTTRSGLDLDALRMYLRWRGLTLGDLRADPDRLRDPDSVGETFEPTDGGTHVGPRTDGDVDETGDGSTAGDPAPTHDDPWAAGRFLDDIDHGAYGTDADTLRGGLRVVTQKDRVLVSPGMPFVVPMALGLVVSLTYGDVLFAVLGALGTV
ncbi:A24 family peptidase [Halorubrum pallidum]|uniref:A24 family peptidase n=1 Tax=Halorubrum pallidum TaxID=1526114 RepID=A0ABD5SYD8_9EURY